MERHSTYLEYGSFGSTASAKAAKNQLPQDFNRMPGQKNFSYSEGSLKQNNGYFFFLVQAKRYDWPN